MEKKKKLSYQFYGIWELPVRGCGPVFRTGTQGSFNVVVNAVLIHSQPVRIIGGGGGAGDGRVQGLESLLASLTGLEEGGGGLSNS